VTLGGWGGWAVLSVCIGCRALLALAEEAHGGRKWRCGATSLSRAEAGGPRQVIEGLSCEHRLAALAPMVTATNVAGRVDGRQGSVLPALITGENNNGIPFNYGACLSSFKL
jgi:hypothetical protein